MLLIIETIKVAQAEGANLAAQTEVGKRRIETQTGPKYDPIFECLAVGGLPFGGLEEVMAPIALRVGDVVNVDQETGFIVRVLRGGEEIWPTVTLTPEPGKAPDTYGLSQEERETTGGKRGKA